MKTIENAGHDMIWTHAEKLAEVIMHYCYMEDRIDGEK
jgi:hypothetical protein